MSTTPLITSDPLAVGSEIIEGYEVTRLHVARTGLENVILRYKLSGYDILYVIPTNTFSYVPITSIPSNAYVNFSPTSVLSTDLLTVCVAKKDPHKDPCPRCAYPYPDSDQLAREE